MANIKLYIKNEVYNSIKDFCKLNEIDDIKKFVQEMVVKGFTLEMYGDLNPTKEQLKKKQKVTDDYDIMMNKKDDEVTQLREMVELLKNELEEARKPKIEEPKKVKVNVTDKALELINKEGLNIEDIEGTGKDGRILLQDVLYFIKRMNEKPKVEEKVVTVTQRIIQKESVQIKPTEEIIEPEPKTTYNDIYGDEGNTLGGWGSNLLD